MARYTQYKQHIWNHFDELGLLVGISRTEGETNSQLKTRILNRYSYTQNSTYQGLTNAISADLGYDPYNVIDKRFFILTYKPDVDQQVVVSVDGEEQTQVVSQWPLPSGWSVPPGVEFNVDPSGLYGSVPMIYDEVDASGYLIWRDDMGEYTQILEFVNAPSNESEVIVEYWYKLDGYLRYYKDYTFSSRPLDDMYGLEGRFTGRSAETSTGITVNALANRAFRTNTANGLMSAEGTAEELLVSIAKLANDVAPILWDYFRWDEGRWDAGDKEETGSEALPILLDASTSGYIIGSG